MSLPPERFDRDIDLAQLLRAVPSTRLETAIGRTVGDVWRIVDLDEVIVCKAVVDVAGRTASAGLIAPATPAACTPEAAVPLSLDFDILGHLVVPQARHAHGRVAATWLQMVLTSASRYQMAADLHLETVHADYETLQAKHAALQESETRYRELAGELEQRVAAQVDVIALANRRLFQAEKAASIGSLAAGMAHEINNPVGFIRSNLGTASAYLATIAKALEVMRRCVKNETDAAWSENDLDFVLEDFSGLLAESVTGADRISRIVANLKTFASIDSDASAPIDLNDAVRASTDLLRDRLPATTVLETDLQPLPLVACDPGRMNQVMLALLQNAQQALGTAPGKIRITTRVADEAIRIDVSDSGCGMHQDIAARIFDPFFTTRDVGKGMGLGLTVSSDIVHAYGGRLEVETAPGRGSIFTLTLPLAPASTETDRVHEA